MTAERRQYHREYMRKYRAGKVTVAPAKLGNSEWRDIEDWPGYQVNRKGEILSLQRVVERSNGRPHTVPQRILKPSPDSNGHMQFKAYPEKTPVFVHREVYKAFMGSIPDGWEIDHKDSNPANNVLGNLQCLTKSQHQNISRQRRVDAGYEAGFKEAVKQLRAQLPISCWLEADVKLDMTPGARL